MDKESFSFGVYIIHACANKWDMTPSQVYRKLQSADVLSAILCLIMMFCILRVPGIL